MNVGVVGDDPTIRVFRDQIEGRVEQIEAIHATDIGDVDVAVAAWEYDDERFSTIGERTIGADCALITIELGGLGGYPLDGVAAGVTTFPSDGPCYQCLRTRVEAVGPEGGNQMQRSNLMGRLMGAYAGTLVAEDGIDDASSDVANVITWPYEEHELLPVPGCVLCDPNPADRFTEGSVDSSGTRSLESALAAAERALDPLLGPVVSIAEAESFPLPYYLSTVAETRPFSDVSATPQAAGVARNWNAAFMKAMGEALERYAAGVYRGAWLTYAEPDALAGAVHPDRFVRPDSWSRVAGEIAWVPGTALATGDACWLPADTVLFPPPERHVRPAITTGLSLGNSPAEAIAGGLLEVIERDAAMLAWYSEFKPLGIRIDDPAFERICRLAGVEDLAVSTSLLTQDVDVPVVASAVHRESEWPQFAVAASADLDPVDAAISATQEAVQNWMELHAMGRESATQEEPRLAEYAADPSRAKEFLADSTVSVSDLQFDAKAGRDAALEQVIAELETAEVHAYAASITTRDLRSLGFEAVRVVIPEAQPLFTGDAYFGQRAETIPQTMGYAPQLDRAPHPFP